MPDRTPSPWRALLASTNRRDPRLVGAGLALAASVGLPLAGPQLIRAFVDGAIRGRPTSALASIALAYLAVAAAGQVATIATSYLTSRVAWAFTNRLRERVAEHTLGLDFDFHGARTAGEMIERVDGDVAGLNDFLSQFVIGALTSSLLLAGALVLLWLASPIVGATLTALVAGGVLVVVRSQRAVVPRADAQREAVAQEFGLLEEALVAAEDVRVNGGGPHVVGRFIAACSRVYLAEVRWQKLGGAVIAGATLLFAGGTAVAVGVGILLLQAGSVTVGTVVLIFSYAEMVRGPVNQITGSAKQLQQASAAARRVAELLSIRPSLRDALAPVALPAGPLSAALRAVNFAYLPGEPVLRNVDLVLPAGRSLGLVGRTGSGKSTVGRLLLRLYDTTEGAVEIGGADVRAIGRHALRKRVRMVTQDVQLFGVSVRDNVTLFDPAPRDEDIAASLIDVGLGRWLDGLPDGLDTMLGPGALGVSAGEAQLLALARVFLTDPGLVVLDEASSRLDAATEALVARATDRLLVDRTAVVIAHRLSSLDRVDDIAVIDGGRIIEYGRRAELAGDPDSHFAALRRAAGLTPV